MKNLQSRLNTVLSGFLLICILASCVDSKKIVYFNNIPKDSVGTVQPQTEQTIISQNDILKIVIGSLDEQTTQILNGLNLVPETNSAAQSTGMLNGYLVDENGTIKIPLIGSVKAAGLTKTELATNIANELTVNKIAIDPIVTVRIISFKITVLGEVNRPGVIPVPNERITLPEAIGSAGDLTVYGKRDNILLIREIGNKRIYKRFSLNDDQLFNKDIYYLQNQDIIYVAPNSAKAALSDRTTQLLPVMFSALSLIVVILSQFR
jgi:polysaccharide biosynthesis/export protein